MKQPKADGRTDMKCYLKGVFRIAVLLLTTFMVLMGCGNSDHVSVENDVVIMYTPSDAAESITSNASESEESITKSSESAGTINRIYQKPLVIRWQTKGIRSES